MFAIWNYVRIFLFGSSLLATFIAAWTIQNWRYAGRETAYLQAEQILTQKEANKQASAATKFEQKLGKTDDIYDAINQALKSGGSSGNVCFDAQRLRLLNSALTRKAPDPGKPSNTLPKP